MTVRVSPEEPPFARFTVWAFDASGNRSAGSTVAVNRLDDVASLHPVTHQWTTDQFWTVPPAADCGAGGFTVDLRAGHRRRRRAAPRTAPARCCCRPA